MTSGPGAAGAAPDGDRQPPVPEQPFLADRLVEDAALALDEVRGGAGPRLQWPLTLVLAGLVVSLVVVADDHFRRGSVLFAGFVLLAFFLRLLLTDADAGWLAVRSRRVDLLCLGALAVGVSVFALVVPAPS